MPARQNFQTVPNFNTVFDSHITGSPSREKPRDRQRPIRHRRSSLDMGMSELGLDHLAPGGNPLGMVPSSFATQMAMANRFGGREARDLARETERTTEAMMGRLMLARMKTLEEGFAEVVKEFRELSTRTTAGNSSVEGSLLGGVVKGKGKEREKVREKRRSRDYVPPVVDFSEQEVNRMMGGEVLHERERDGEADSFHDDTHVQRMSDEDEHEEGKYLSERRSL